jgi:hypothetical protein
MAKKDPKALLKQGWIHVLVTFEIIGKPAAHVDKSLKMFLDDIKKHEDKVVWLEEHAEPAEQTTENDEFFGAFAEVDMLIKDLETITWLATDYTPASIEIIEPTSFDVKALVIQNWTNDLLSKLHTIGAGAKSQNSQLEYLKQNLQQLIHNTILLSLGRGAKNVEALAKDTSLTKEALVQHLAKLKEAKKVAEKKGVYSLA